MTPAEQLTQQLQAHIWQWNIYNVCLSWLYQVTILFHEIKSATLFNILLVKSYCVKNLPGRRWQKNRVLSFKESRARY